MFLKPAEYVIRVFDGPMNLAKSIGIPKKNITMWLAPREMRGCGGFIPRSAQGLILLKAESLGLDITARDIILGREVADG